LEDTERIYGDNWSIHHSSSTTRVTIGRHTERIYGDNSELSLEDTLKEFIEISTIQVPQPELSFEDTVKAFIKASSQNIQELKSITMSNSQIIRA
jgi:hypothetical protein